MFDRLLALFLVFAPLSLVSIGGGTSIFAEMQRQTVSVHGWLTDAQFTDLFAISRAAPGPGSLICAGVYALMRSGGLLEWATLAVSTAVLLRGGSPYTVMIVAACLYIGLFQGGLLGG